MASRPYEFTRTNILEVSVDLTADEVRTALWSAAVAKINDIKNSIPMYSKVRDLTKSDTTFIGYYRSVETSDPVLGQCVSAAFRFKIENPE